MTLGATIAIVSAILVFFTTQVTAAVKVSVEDGDWLTIRWLPGGGPPGPTDTAIVSSHVTSMPTGQFGVVLVNNIGTVEMGPGERTLAGLHNAGRVRLDTATRLVIDGDLANIGSMIGGGLIVLIRDSSSISSSTPLGRLLIGGTDRVTVRLAGALVATSVTVISSALLDLGEHDLLIRGSLLTSRKIVGVTATSGSLTVLGHARGWIDASVVLGGQPAEWIGRAVPEVSGVIGGVGRTITIHGLRRARFCRFVGELDVSSDGVLHSDGIGLRASNDVIGMLRVDGALGAEDPEYLWRVDGNIEVAGIITGCRLEISGAQRTLVSDGGRWDGSVRLRYRSPSSGSLELFGHVDLSELVIEGMSSGDSNIAVRSDTGSVRIRHLMRSRADLNCRLECGGTVHLFDTLDGAVEGNVVVEGFWGSSICGQLGGEGDTVSVMMPKRVERPLTIVGTFVQRPRGRLVVASRLTLPRGAILGAENEISVDGAVQAFEALAIDRDVRGGGVIEIAGTTSVLRTNATLRDSVMLRIGYDSLETMLTIDGRAAIAGMEIAAGSAIGYLNDSRIDVMRTARYGLRMRPGFQLVSAAVLPAGASAAQAFPGANSDVFTFDGGYVAVDTIAPGYGYWVSYPQAGIIEQVGDIVQPEVEVLVQPGWNLIGCPSVFIAPAALNVTSTTILSGPFDSDSQLAVTLIPGQAYWIEVSTAGVIRFR